MYSHTGLRSAAASSDTHRTLPHRQEATGELHLRTETRSRRTHLFNCVGSDTLTVTDVVQFHISRSDQN